MSMFGGQNSGDAPPFARAGEGAALPGVPGDAPEGRGASPLAGLGADGAPGFGGSASGLKSGVLVLALVVVIAGGSLYLMRKFGLGGGLQFVNISIDYPVGADAPKRDTDKKHLQVLQDLKTSDALVQVPLKDLQCNPFALGVSDRATPTPSASLSPEEIAARERAERERQTQNTFAALRLNTILTGQTPLARISGQPYRIGDVVAGVFTVKSIHGRGVELEADGRVYTLTIGGE